MNNFDMLKNMDIDEFVDWLSRYGNYEYNPWDEWFDITYCNNVKCPIEKAYSEYFEKEKSYSWCELNNKCKFFPELEGLPGYKEVLKMWLMLEAK